MDRHKLLQSLHERLRPRTYFEIGVRKGRSLTLSRVPSVGVDPFFVLTRELRCDVHLVRTTSDEFFARRHPFAHFDQPVVDLAFIDGMHLAEFALRDFINTERHCHPASVIVIDDVLPRTVVEGGRGRVGTAIGGAWAGDVYKVIDVLRRHRPDLVVLELDTRPTGTLVIMLPDPSDTTLAAEYDAVLPELVVPDPQTVPGWALERSRAIDPRLLLDAPIWGAIREAREQRGPEAREKLGAVFAGAGLPAVKERR
ncbi:MAG: methyltransferase type 11 [Nocardioides sp.]|nr:methyltransferase type 11 [Nocardioides sp.]